MYYISESEAQYMDANQGHFSKALAKWAPHTGAAAREQPRDSPVIER